MSLLPTRPLRTPGLPAEPVVGSVRQSPDDFVVEEIPIAPPSGSGPHLWLSVRKRGLSTFEVVERLARTVGVKPQHCGHAGLKDKNAVTTQWLSVPKQGADLGTLEALEREDCGFEILSRDSHHSRLKTGQLRGNRFAIRVDGLGEEAIDPLRKNLDHLARHGLPNWFGEQRFGSGGRNLAKGLRILHDPRARGLQRMRKQLVKLLVASVQSEVFHHVLAERLDSYTEMTEGDIAWLHHNGACFRVESPLEEQIRADRFEISPTGPLPGPKMLEARGDQGELEQAVFDALELQPSDFGALPFPAAPGARRPLRVRVTDQAVEFVTDQGARNGLWLHFTLERGAFATTVLRDLLLDQPWFEGAGDGGSDPDRSPGSPPLG